MTSRRTTTSEHVNTKKETGLRGQEGQLRRYYIVRSLSKSFHRAGNNRAMFARDNAVLDSGATANMMKNNRIITLSRKTVLPDIITAGKSSVKANLEGGAKELMTGGANSLDMSRVPCVPDLRDNLISVGGLRDDGHTVMLIKRACTVLNSDAIVGLGEREGAFMCFVSGNEVVRKGHWLQKVEAPRC